MLQRFIDLAPYISDIFSKIDAPTMLTAVELNIIKDVTHVMRPLEAMTRETSAERLCHYFKSCANGELSN